MNEYIVENEFVNLDFMGNLGNSIVKTKGDRVYIEKGNMMKLGDVKYFTFEPRIAFADSKYGYKKENIYYFGEKKYIRQKLRTIPIYIISRIMSTNKWS